MPTLLLTLTLCEKERQSGRERRRPKEKEQILYPRQNKIKTEECNPEEQETARVRERRSGRMMMTQ